MTLAEYYNTMVIYKLQGKCLLREEKITCTGEASLEDVSSVINLIGKPRYVDSLSVNDYTTQVTIKYYFANKDDINRLTRYLILKASTLCFNVPSLPLEDVLEITGLGWTINLIKTPPKRGVIIKNSEFLLPLIFVG